MSFLDSIGSMFGMGNNSDVNNYLGQIPGVGQQYLGPYASGGVNAMNTMQNQYSQMMDPTAFIAALMKNYQPSAQYQANLQNMTSQLANTAAAGGISGTPLHQQQQGQLANQLLSQDQQQYLQNALGVLGTGLSGENSIFNTGANASNNLADMIGGALNSQGSLAFLNNEQNTNNLSSMLGSGFGYAQNKGWL